MEQPTRRTFFKHLGVSAGAAAAVPLIAASPASATTYTGTIQGPVHDEGGAVFDIRSEAYGAKGNTVLATGGSMTSGSAILTRATGSFAAADVGKLITVQGAGASAGVLSTTIASFNPSTPNQVTLATNALSPAAGKDFAYGNDDTAAIVAAVTAANGSGRVFAPPGVYMIRGASNGNAPIELSGSAGLEGCGAKAAGLDINNMSTCFLCYDETAGILANGCGTFQGFRVDGNNIAKTPMRNGTIVSNQATTASANATFIGIWAMNAAAPTDPDTPPPYGAGWTIYGAQNNAYYDCRALTNGRYGIYISGGAGGLDFIHWHEFSTRTTYVYGLLSDDTVAGGTGTFGDHTENIQFTSGIIDGQAEGVSRVYLRKATNWRFRAMSIVGSGSISGPCIDLDQSYGYGIDFTGCWLWAFNSGTDPGQACIQVSGDAAHPLKTFLITDGVFFSHGDASVYLKEVCNCTAVDWMYDQTRKKPIADSGLPGIDTMLRGRTGKWQAVTTSAPWSGTISYRVDSDGMVRFKGRVTCTAAASGTLISALTEGYRPASDIRLPASMSVAGSAYVTITSAGLVTGNAPAAGTLSLDGLTFEPA